MNHQMLVNKFNKVYQEIIDKTEMIEFRNEYSKFSLFLEKETYEMFNNLKSYVYEQKKIIMDLEDGYRSPENSQKLYDEYKELYGVEYAQKYVALPYTSEHNIGLACDYVIKKDGIYIENSLDYELLDESIFINSIAHEFGFIVRYPKGKEEITGYNYEPWHLRYVGVELATYLFLNNLTLEERFDLEHLLLADPILNYEKYNSYIEIILNKSSNNKKIYQIKEEKELGKTNFDYSIRHFRVGIGQKHIIVNGNTHGCEIITASFVLELMNKIAEQDSMFEHILNEITIHFIPLLNPEGFIISTSAIDYVFKGKNDKEKLDIMIEYLENAKKDDVNINTEKNKNQKLHRKTFENCTPDCISDEHRNLRENIRKLIKDYNLPSSILGTWSANGMGVDLNKNHPFNFDFYKKDREENPYPQFDRNDDIDRSKPGPIGYIGDSLDSNDSIENKLFLQFIERLHSDTLGIFLYHSVGGMIFAEVNKELPRTEESIYNTNEAAKEYSHYTSYKIINEVPIMAFNGYLRSKYNAISVLLIELSRIRANPIGTFSNPYNYKYTIHTNCEAFAKTSEKMLRLFKEKLNYEKTN